MNQQQALSRTRSASECEGELEYSGVSDVGGMSWTVYLCPECAAEVWTLGGGMDSWNYEVKKEDQR